MILQKNNFFSYINTFLYKNTAFHNSTTHTCHQNKHKYKHITFFITLLILFFIPAAAFADYTFSRPRMTFSFGIDVFDFFIGDFGDAANVGMSIHADATLQVGHFAGYIRFGSARALTEKEFLPFDEGFQFVFISAAPRFYFPLMRRTLLYAFIQPQITVNFFESNTLVALTGNRLADGLVGGSVGLQFIAGIIAITGQVSCEYDWHLKTILVTGGINIGITSTLGR